MHMSSRSSAWPTRRWLAEGSADEMIEKMNEHMAEAIREKFERAMEARKHKDESVEAGREYVKAYVT